MSSYINSPIHTYRMRNRAVFVLDDASLWFYNTILLICAYGTHSTDDINTNLKCGKLLSYAIKVIGYTKQAKIRWMLENKWKRKKGEFCCRLTAMNIMIHRYFLSIGSQLNGM